MSVEACNVEGKSGGGHHLLAGSTKNDAKGDGIDTPKGDAFVSAIYLSNFSDSFCPD